MMYRFSVFLIAVVSFFAIQSIGFSEHFHSAPIQLDSIHLNQIGDYTTSEENGVFYKDKTEENSHHGEKKVKGKKERKEEDEDDDDDKGKGQNSHHGEKKVKGKKEREEVN